MTKPTTSTAATTAATAASGPEWYAATETPELVEFGTVQGLGIVGQGEPGGRVYGESSQALFAVAGALTAVSAGAFSIPPLEGRWWVEDARPVFEVPRAEWWWQLFLRLRGVVPAPPGLRPSGPAPTSDGFDPAWFDAAREAARPDVPAAARVQLVAFTPGPCVQALHCGPYADEPATLARMDALMRERGVTVYGLHHELYLSDVRETDPARMRTILRQPVRAAR
ncbi:GyrI-like domain-containing protein [Actinopolymorpha alba]|uniref:GyrI-like domain-containing protein n=1 Tax=Actinopolymorpha alba TaxID=533267 RepID=UPI00035EFC39|nr:GyrI-like domain-containing protein [Actinopolymorpha alba]